VLDNILAKLLPIISSRSRLLVPKVKLEFALGEGRPGEALVWTFFPRNFHGSFHGSMVDSLEDVIRDLNGSLVLESYLHHLKSIGKTLDTDTDWPMLHV